MNFWKPPTGNSNYTIQVLPRKPFKEFRYVEVLRSGPLDNQSRDVLLPPGSTLGDIPSYIMRGCNVYHFDGIDIAAPPRFELCVTYLHCTGDEAVVGMFRCLEEG